MLDTNLFAPLFSQICQVTAVAIVVWIVTRILASDRPHLAHVLWMLVLIKVLTPPIWSSPASPFCWMNCLTQNSQIVTENETQQSPEVNSIAGHTNPQPRSTVPSSLSQTTPVSPAVTNSDSATAKQNLNRDASLPTPSVTMSAGTTANWQSILTLLWIGGAVVGLGLLVIRYALFVRWLRRATERESPEIVQLAQGLAQQLGLRRTVRVRVLENSVGPVVLGLLRPTVVLPAAIVRGKSTEELAPLLAHEMIHIRRGDLWWALIQAVAKNLFWFHPLVYWAERQVSREAERSCDEETIASLGCSSAVYARCLLGVLEQKHWLRVAPALPGVRPVEITSARLERVMKLGNGIHGKTPTWTWLVLLMGCVVTLPGAAWTRAQESSRNSTETSKSSQTNDQSESSNSRTKAQNLLTKLQEIMIKFQDDAPRNPTSQENFVLRSRLYNISSATVETLEVSWQTYRNWPAEESNEKCNIVDSTNSITVISKIPVNYSILDSSQLEQLLVRIQQQPDSIRIEAPIVRAQSGTPVEVLEPERIPIQVGPIEYAGSPDTVLRSTVHHISQGLNLNLIPTARDADRLKLNIGLVSHKIDTFGQVSSPHGQAGESLKPEKPKVTWRLMNPEIEFDRDHKLVMLVSDQNQQPMLVIIEPMSGAEQANLKTKLKYSAQCQMFPGHSEDGPQYQISGSVDGQAPVTDLLLSISRPEIYRFATDAPKISIEDSELVRCEFVSPQDAIFTGLKPGKTRCTHRLADGAEATFEVEVRQPMPGEVSADLFPHMSTPVKVGIPSRIQFQHPIKEIAIRDKDWIQVERLDDRQILVKPLKPGLAKLKIVYQDQGSIHVDVPIADLKTQLARVLLPSSHLASIEQSTPNNYVSIRAAAEPVPNIVVLCNGDDPNDLAHCRVVPYFDREIAVSKSVRLTQQGESCVLSGKNFVWMFDGNVMASADQGELVLQTFKGEESYSYENGEVVAPNKDQTYSIKLVGNAVYDHSQLWQANQITFEYGNEIPVKFNLQGSVRMLTPEPFYREDSSRGYDATADVVTCDDSKTVNYFGSVRIVNKSLAGDVETYEGEEIRVSENATAFQVIKPKQD